MTLSASEIQARTLAGYAVASRMRQANDREWILANAPARPSVHVDLGSGIGQLMEAALDRFPTLTRAIGLEASSHRLAEARARLDRFGERVSLRQADLTAPEPLDAAADLITMTSVLHWLYPVEDRILHWVARHLAPGGSFLLTTYHPARDGDGFGGTDDLARDALAAVGVDRDRVPEMFAAQGVLAIGTRCRDAAQLARMMAPGLRVVACDEREAIVRTESAEQYEHFHAATFGDYYSRLLEPERRAAYFRAVGETGWRRQRETGYVTSMPVRRWEVTTRE